MVLILVLTTLVGSCLLLVLGSALATGRTRRSFATSPKAFRCKVGTDRQKGPTAGLRWPWRWSYAVWIHDSLFVVSGVLRTKVRPLAVHFAEGAVTCALDSSRAGAGADAVFLSLELDDGTHTVIAAPRSAKSLVAGPYLAALLSVGAPRSAGMGS